MRAHRSSGRLLAAAIAVLLLAGGTSLAVEGPTRHGGQDVVVGIGGPTRQTAFDGTPGVPWKDLPPAPDPTPRAPLATTRPCRSSDLAFSKTEPNGASQVQYFYISLINISPTACSLSGFPDAVITFPTGGVQRPVPSSETGIVGPPAARYAVNPGAGAEFTVVQPDTCPNDGSGDPSAATGYQVQVTLPGGGQRSIPIPFTGVPVCGLAVTRYALAYPSAASSPMNALTATVDVPPAVDRAATLSYSVTLTNPTGQAIRLQPCPNYTEGVFARPPTSTETYQLNCASAAAIGAYRSVRFEMEAPFPSTEPPPKNLVFISWQLLDVNGAGFGDAVASASSRVGS